MGLRAGSARPQRVSGSARTDSQRAQSARNPIAANVKFGDDSALSAFTRTQWTAAFTVHCEFQRVRITGVPLAGYQTSKKRNLRSGHLLRPGDVTFGVIGLSFFLEICQIVVWSAMANLAARRRFFAICEKPYGGGGGWNHPPAGARVKIMHAR